MVVAATLALASACSDDDSAPSGPPDVRFAPVPASGDERPIEVSALPLSSLLVRSPEFDRGLFVVREAAIADCMNAAGFEFPDREYFALTERMIIDHPFGPWSIADAANGYVPDEDAGPVSDPIEEYLRSLSAAERDAWYVAYLGESDRDTEQITVELADGTRVNSGFRADTAEGCDYQATSEFLGDYAGYEAYRQTLQGWASEAWDTTRSSKVVRQSLSAWGDCMGDSGFGGYDDPTDVLEKYVSRPLDDEQREVASADVRCKVEARLYDAWFSVKVKVETDIVEDHPDVVAEWRQVLDSAVAAVSGN